LQQLTRGEDQPGYLRYAYAVARGRLEECKAGLNRELERLDAVHAARQQLHDAGVAPWVPWGAWLATEFPALHESLVAGPPLRVPGSGLPAAAPPAAETPTAARSDGGDGGDDGWQVVRQQRSPAQQFAFWQRGGDVQRRPDGRTPVDGPLAAAADRGAGTNGGDALEALSLSPDAWRLPPPTRRRLVCWWLDRMEADARDGVSTCAADVDAAAAAARRIDDEQILSALHAAVVVGATTTKAADLQALIATWAPTIVVVEEAGEVTEAHTLAALHGGVQQLLLVGDHKQLRPKTTVYELSVAGRRGYNLDVSLFERLADVVGYTNVHALSTQRRMRPAIASLIRDTVYPSLVDAPCVDEYPAGVAGMGAPLFWWDHTAHEDRAPRRRGAVAGGGRSHANTREVALVVGLVRYLMQQGFQPARLVVLTGYVGQLQLLRRALLSLTAVAVDDRDREELEALGEPAAADAGASGASGSVVAAAATRGAGGGEVRVATVDNFVSWWRGQPRGESERCFRPYWAAALSSCVACSTLKQTPLTWPMFPFFFCMCPPPLRPCFGLSFSLPLAELTFLSLAVAFFVCASDSKGRRATSSLPPSCGATQVAPSASSAPPTASTCCCRAPNTASTWSAPSTHSPAVPTHLAASCGLTSTACWPRPGASARRYPCGASHTARPSP